MIPSGIYCYDKNGLCQNFKTKFINGVKTYWCKHLNKSGLSNDMTDEEFKALQQFHKTDDIDQFYPLLLLWDQVKECDVNTGDEYEI